MMIQGTLINLQAMKMLVRAMQHGLETGLPDVEA
jgi:hypothetical protein